VDLLNRTHSRNNTSERSGITRRTRSRAAYRAAGR